MATGQRENISIYLKDDDRDVERWLEEKQDEIRKSTGIKVALGPVIIGQLRRLMGQEHE